MERDDDDDDNIDMVADVQGSAIRADREARVKDDAVMAAGERSSLPTKSKTRPSCGVPIMKIDRCDPLDDGLNRGDEIDHQTCANDDTGLAWDAKERAKGN